MKELLSPALKGECADTIEYRNPSKPNSEKKESTVVDYSRFNLTWMDELGIYPKIIFDVGCHNGGDSIRFKRRWNTAQVHAFEADPDIERRIKKYMKYEGIILNNVGVLEKGGKCVFYPAKAVKNPDAICGGGTFIKSRADDGDSRLNFLNPITIKTISLYTYCQKNNITEIDLLHIDAEGVELNVIKGLKNIRPKVIFAEQHPHILTSEEINNFHTYMKEQNYLLHCKAGINYLYVKGN